MLVKVEWDEAKNLANQKNHGVSFEEASELLNLELEYLDLFDEDHSDHEDRFIAIGPISRGIILVVWTARDEDVVRIISARFASKREQEMFFTYMEQWQ